MEKKGHLQQSPAGFFWVDSHLSMPGYMDEGQRSSGDRGVECEVGNEMLSLRPKKTTESFSYFHVVGIPIKQDWNKNSDSIDLPG